MKRTTGVIAVALLLAALAACTREETPAASSATTGLEEKTYEMVGTIVGRDPATNKLTVNHEDIPGYMAAMTMPYEVRGQNVADLPPDGTPITATVHATEAAYWLTDVTPAPGAATETTGTAAPGSDTTVTTGTTDTGGTTTGS